MKTNVSYYQNKKEFRLFVTQSYSQLIQLKKEGDQASFNALVLKIMPQIRQYINTQLNVAIRKGHFSKNKFKADDIIDQLFIEIYDHIEDVKQENDFYVWLFKKTNDLLEDITVEEEFDEFFFKNIDDYTRPEWDEMQEKYSTDGGGDLLHNLPVNMRTVFELATTQHLELEEIAQIRHNTLEEVKQLLSDAKKALQISLFNRYSVN